MLLRRFFPLCVFFFLLLFNKSVLQPLFPPLLPPCPPPLSQDSLLFCFPSESSMPSRDISQTALRLSIFCNFYRSLAFQYYIFHNSLIILHSMFWSHLLLHVLVIPLKYTLASQPFLNACSHIDTNLYKGSFLLLIFNMF